MPSLPTFAIGYYVMYGARGASDFASITKPFATKSEAFEVLLAHVMGDRSLRNELSVWYRDKNGGFEQA